MGNIPESMDNFKEETKYVIICRSGHRSGKVAAYLDSQGSEGTIVKWYPGPGTPTNLDYSFKYVSLAPSMEAWGVNSESFVNNGGLLVQQEIFGNIVSCDSPRLYLIDAYGGQQ